MVGDSVVGAVVGTSLVVGVAVVVVQSALIVS